MRKYVFVSVSAAEHEPHKNGSFLELPGAGSVQTGHRASSTSREPRPSCAALSVFLVISSVRHQQNVFKLNGCPSHLKIWPPEKKIPKLFGDGAAHGTDLFLKVLVNALLFSEDRSCGCPGW